MDLSVGTGVLSVVIGWIAHFDTVRWLFLDECETATTLLSMSFAINSIFTGLSFSSFNICDWMKRKAHKCMEDSVDAGFLADVERVGKENKDVCRLLAKYSETVNRYRSAMQNWSPKWEWTRRITTIGCAASAFVLVAFEVHTRLGVVLGLPFVTMLLLHLVWIVHRSLRVSFVFKKLRRAMDELKKTKNDAFEIETYIKGIKSDIEALKPVRKSACKKK